MAEWSAEQKRTWASGAALLAIVFLCFLPAIRAAFIWDDPSWLTDNRTIRRGDGIWFIWAHPSSLAVNEGGAPTQPYPMVFTSYWVEYQTYAAIFGPENALNPIGYHLVNILLHAGSALLLWRLLVRLKLRGAWLAAVLWAIHPVQVESVAWAAERKNVLAGVFFWASLLAYFRFALPETPSASALKKWAWYALAMVLFLAALGSKTVTCVAPGLILVILWWKRGLTWRSALAVAPLLVVGLSLARIMASHEAMEVGASGNEFGFSYLQRFAMAGKAFWFYLGKIAWPHPLLAVYPRWNVNRLVPVGLIYTLSAVVLLTGLWGLRNKIGRGPFAALAAFGVILSPALCFVNFYSMLFTFVADHYQYLACAAPLVLLAEMIAGYQHKLAAQSSMPSGGRWFGLHPQSVLIGALLVGILGAVSTRQALLYQSNLALWEYTAARNPDNWVVQHGLGAGYIDQINEGADPRECYAAAKEAYLRSWDLRHDVKNARAMGGVLVELGDREGAEVWYRRALDIEPADVAANLRLGILLAAGKRHAEAQVYLKNAVKYQPANPENHFNLALTLSALGDRDGARVEYQQTIARNPLHLRARYNYGNMLLDDGNYAAAVEQYQVVVENNPYIDAYRNLAFALSKIPGRMAEANTANEKAIQMEEALRAAQATRPGSRGNPASRAAPASRATVPASAQ